MRPLLHFCAFALTLHEYLFPSIIACSAIYVSMHFPCSLIFQVLIVDLLSSPFTDETATSRMAEEPPMQPQQMPLALSMEVCTVTPIWVEKAWWKRRVEIKKES